MFQLLHYSLVTTLLAVSPYGFSTTLKGTGPIVNTTSGSYVGVHDAQNFVDIFKGVRFASPPTRFTPATPIQVANAPEGPQSAAAFGADCPQPTRLVTAGIPAGPPLRGADQSEDCLFVNVRTIFLVSEINQPTCNFCYSRSGVLQAFQLQLRRGYRSWFTFMSAHPFSLVSTMLVSN